MSGKMFGRYGPLESFGSMGSGAGAREARSGPEDELGGARPQGAALGRGAEIGQLPGHAHDIGVVSGADGGADASDGADSAGAEYGGDTRASAAYGGGTRATSAAYDSRAETGAGHDGRSQRGAVYGGDAYDDSSYDDAHDRDAQADVSFGTGGGSGSGGDDGDRHGRSHPTGGGFGGGFGGEDDLRRLLQSRVGDLEPAPDALEQLRRAVPARRQRRRHVVVGAAAALLLGGTSIPAMVHAVNLADGSTDRPANAASSQATQGSSEGAHGEGTEQAGPRPTDKGGAQPGGGVPEGKGKATERNGAGHGAGAGTPAPDETMDVTSPVCSRDQLGQGSGTVQPADSAGRVYGSFRVVNTSSTPCSVEGGGTVGVVAQGSTKPDRIHVVDHTSGDEATGLPDPATTPDQLVLKPGEAYEVKFAWIPEAGGGSTGCVNPGPSPTPDPSKDPGQSPDAGATTSGDSGSGQAGGETGSGDGGAASGGIVLNHTPEAGEPAAADATVADACAGTVYRTGAVAAQ